MPGRGAVSTGGWAPGGIVCGLTGIVTAGTFTPGCCGMPFLEQAELSRVLPDRVKAVMHRHMAEPGSADEHGAERNDH